MSVLHDLKDVPLEIDLSVKELVVERLHGDLLAGICVLLEVTVLEVDIVRNGFTGQSDFLIDSRADSGHEGPVSDRDGDDENDEEEEVEEPSGSEGEDLGDYPWCDNDTSEEMEIVEGSGTFSWQWGIGDRGVRGAGLLACCAPRVSWESQLTWCSPCWPRRWRS